ncbi:putative inorganic phosphate cotransporter [Pieris brassicae]|uniref:putative inorganic phosphate cotransporter n=1 Tax=Pieris brassicae TaxID=7116 RepID=UPI001E661C9A|nr:putative inorganic phosphate cotransporter [Pieris brassicae]
MLTGWRLVVSKLFIIPQRYVLAIMGLLTMANAFTLRQCLNLAITQMVKKKATPEVGSVNYDPDACPDFNVVNSTTGIGDYLIDDDSVKFEWSEATQGLILGAFYLGYIATHIPGGMLAEKFGGKWVVALGLLSTAICTFITPYAVKTGGAVALIILRVIEGIGEGPTMPGLMLMISKWAPKTERSVIGAIVFGGSQIGNVAGSYFSGLIMHQSSWENVFYLFGGVGLVWFAAWIIFCYSSPNTHPYISDCEKKYLNENVESLSNNEVRLNPVPWRALVRSVPLWALIIAGIGHDWGYYTMVTDLPKYMTDVLKFDIKSTGILSSMPYIAMWFTSVFFGFLSDFGIKRGFYSLQNARKIFTTIAAIGPGVCIILASYSGCNTTLAVIWFVTAMAFMSAYYSGMKINVLDITPNYAGTTTAIVNGISSISGIVSPYLIGLLTPNSTLKQWRVAFWVCFVVLFVTNFVFVIYGKGQQEWWDDVKLNGYPAGWKHGPLPKRENDSESPPKKIKEKQEL